jgi:SAM-dependent methyltransferase
MYLLAGLVVTALPVEAAPASEQGQINTRDATPGEIWIERLERPDRIPGLRIDDVIASLKLKPGDVVADIGAGTGAFSIPFAKAVAPTGTVLAQDIWPELLDYIARKAKKEHVGNLQTVLGKGDDPNLPQNHLDLAFFHDVFHNAVDRQGYLEILARSLKPGGRIAIVEQEFDDPIAQKWDIPEDRITHEQLAGWMSAIGFELIETIDIFQGENNPKGAGMPERWFVIYGPIHQASNVETRAGASTSDPLLRAESGVLRRLPER